MPRKDGRASSEPLRRIRSVRSLLSEGSARLVGFRLELASTAVRVLELVRSERFDLVLIDADLDGPDGPLSRALRSEGFLGAVVLLAAPHATEITTQP